FAAAPALYLGDVGMGSGRAALGAVRMSPMGGHWAKPLERTVGCADGGQQERFRRAPHRCTDPASHLTGQIVHAQASRCLLLMAAQRQSARAVRMVSKAMASALHWLRRSSRAGALGFVLALPCRSFALDEASSAPASGASAPSPAPPGASPKRAVPDYDGRGEAPTTTGDVLIWIPRVLLFPPYFVSEVLIREPLGFLIAGAERAGVPALLYDFFTFGPDHQAGLVPTAFVDFDFYPSVGLYGFWNNALVRGHDLRLRGSFGGEKWLAAAFSERVSFGQDRAQRLAFEAGLTFRPDYTYFGIGPDTRQA